MTKLLNRILFILLIMISIVISFNNKSDKNNEIYYDNFKHTNNINLSNIDGTNFDYSATLNEVGDYYEIDFDVINPTPYDIEIDQLDIHKDDNYIQYRLAYQDGELVNEGDTIKNGETKTLRYIVLYKNEVLIDNYDFDSSFNINYKQTF